MLFNYLSSPSFVFMNKLLKFEFSCADLTKADLKHANLSSACFSGANL